MDSNTPKPEPELVASVAMAAFGTVSYRQSEATAKQRRFVEEYLIDLNATQAAIRAGYSEQTARQIGCENLAKPDIQAAIATAMEERSRRTSLTADVVLQELARIALFDMRKMYHADGSLKSVHELGDDAAAVLAGVDVVEEYTGSGEDRKLSGYTKKVKVHDKVPALTLAMRHLGMLNDKLNVKAEGTLASLVAASYGNDGSGPTLTEQGRAVVASVATGQLSPGQGAALISSLGTLGKLTETEELEARIAALEKKA